MSSPLQYKILPLGDHAFTVEFCDSIDETINKKIIILFQQLKQKNISFIKDIIPGYSSITFIYDVIAVRKKHSSAHSFIKQEIENAIAECDLNKISSPRKIEIPVCYDISLGIDLEEMSQQKIFLLKKLFKFTAIKLIGFI